MTFSSKTLLKGIGIGAAAICLMTASVDSAHARGSKFKNFFKGSRHQHHHGRHDKGQVPEIDPGTAGTAITLLAGGLAVLRDRRRKG